MEIELAKFQGEVLNVGLTKDRKRVLVKIDVEGDEREVECEKGSNIQAGQMITIRTIADVGGGGAGTASRNTGAAKPNYLFDHKGNVMIDSETKKPFAAKPGNLQDEKLKSRREKAVMKRETNQKKLTAWKEAFAKEATLAGKNFDEYVATWNENEHS